ncbi:hypothetical protein MMC21_003821 [Puttea exsequens]|nr:hypothetical protein [Puttea exsequens]
MPHHSNLHWRDPIPAQTPRHSVKKLFKRMKDIKKVFTRRKSKHKVPIASRFSVESDESKPSIAEPQVEEKHLMAPGSPESIPLLDPGISLSGVDAQHGLAEWSAVRRKTPSPAGSITGDRRDADATLLIRQGAQSRETAVLTVRNRTSQPSSGSSVNEKVANTATPQHHNEDEVQSLDVLDNGNEICAEEAHKERAGVTKVEDGVFNHVTPREAAAHQLTMATGHQARQRRLAAQAAPAFTISFENGPTELLRLHSVLGSEESKTKPGNHRLAEKPPAPPLHRPKPRQHISKASQAPAGDLKPPTKAPSSPIPTPAPVDGILRDDHFTLDTLTRHGSGSRYPIWTRPGPLRSVDPHHRATRSNPTSPTEAKPSENKPRRRRTQSDTALHSKNELWRPDRSVTAASPTHLPAPTSSESHRRTHPRPHKTRARPVDVPATVPDASPTAPLFGLQLPPRLHHNSNNNNPYRPPHPTPASTPTRTRTPPAPTLRQHQHIPVPPLVPLVSPARALLPRALRPGVGPMSPPLLRLGSEKMALDGRGGARAAQGVGMGVGRKNSELWFFPNPRLCDMVLPFERDGDGDSDFGFVDVDVDGAADVDVDGAGTDADGSTEVGYLRVHGMGIGEERRRWSDDSAFRVVREGIGRMRCAVSGVL